MSCSTLGLLMAIAGVAIGASTVAVCFRCRKDFGEIRRLTAPNVVPEAVLVEEAHVVTAITP